MSGHMETVQKDRPVAIALGGNLDFQGDSAHSTLLRALEELILRGIHVRRVSRTYQTPAHPAGSGPDYINAAALIGTELPAEALLALLHEVEAGFARERNARWASRTVDLDLLLDGDRIAPDADAQRRWLDLPPGQQRAEAPDRLILPHPRMQDRAFVLIPLADILPGWVHPVTGQSVRQMAEALPADEIAAICPV